MDGRDPAREHPARASGSCASSSRGPAIEDLDGLFKGGGAILVALGLIIIIATARTLTAEEKRIGTRPAEEVDQMSELGAAVRQLRHRRERCLAGLGAVRGLQTARC